VGMDVLNKKSVLNVKEPVINGVIMDYTDIGNILTEMMHHEMKMGFAE